MNFFYHHSHGVTITYIVNGSNDNGSGLGDGGDDSGGGWKVEWEDDTSY